MSLCLSPRNLPRPVAGRDASRLWRTAKRPVRHGRRHPLPSANVHKLSPLRAQPRPSRCAGGRRRHHAHGQCGGRAGREPSGPRRVCSDSSERGRTAEEEERPLPAVHPEWPEASPVGVQKLFSQSAQQAELLLQRGRHEHRQLGRIRHPLQRQ